MGNVPVQNAMDMTGSVLIHKSYETSSQAKGDEEMGEDGDESEKEVECIMSEMRNLSTLSTTSATHEYDDTVEIQPSELISQWAITH